MGLSKDDNWIAEVEYEGNNAYCTHCGLLGHVIGMRRKKYPHLITPKSTENDKKPKKVSPKDKQVYRHKHTSTDGNVNMGGTLPNNLQAPISILKRGDTDTAKARAILKEVGLESSDNMPRNEGPQGIEDIFRDCPPRKRTTKN